MSTDLTFVTNEAGNNLGRVQTPLKRLALFRLSRWSSATSPDSLRFIPRLRMSTKCEFTSGSRRTARLNDFRNAREEMAS